MRLSHLTDNKQHFAQWLLEVGHDTNLDTNRTIPFDINMRVDDSDTLINIIYPNIEQLLPPPSYFIDRIILAPRNADVKDLNCAILQCFPGELLTNYSADSIEMEPGVFSNCHQIPLEYLRSINHSGLPPGELHVKLGCPLILLQNLAPAQGLCNRTRLILCHATHRVLKVEILGGQHNGQVTFIPHIALIPSTQPAISFQLCCCQFPI